MKIADLLENKSYDNTSSTTIQLVKILNVPVTASTIIETLEQHPDFPSLLSISESLSKWNIAHAALKIKEELLSELPTPFIAHSHLKKGRFILVTAVNGHIEYIDNKGRPKLKSKEEFIKEWDNVVLLAERNEISGDRHYRSKRRKEIIDHLRIPFIVAVCILLLLLFKFTVPSAGTTHFLLLLTKFAGCIVSALLLWFELDKDNPTLKEICTVGKKTNCTAVLSSKQAKLFNFISWSEIGFFYFAGGFLLLLQNSVPAATALSLISFLNALALPYTAFSLLYQWKIARQWCPLCLTVQGLLILEFVTCYFGYWSSFYSPDIMGYTILSFFTAFLLPVFFWVATKSVYVKAQDLKQFKKDLGQLTYNREIFESLLVKQKAITVPADGIGITLGNPDAKNTVIKVCNPFCGPCSRAHPEIDKLLEHNSDVKVQVIFAGIKDDANDRINKAVAHLMAIYEKNDPDLIKEALDEWYVNSKGNYEAFAAKYPLSAVSTPYVDNMLPAMKNWCRQTEIAFTPTFFVNGYQLPEVYRIEHLKQIL